MGALKIFSEPPMEIDSVSEVSAFFRSGGKLSFRIPRKLKQVYVRHIKRLNRLEGRRRKQSGYLNGFVFRLYFIYTAVLEQFICWNQDSLRHSFWIYNCFICEIESFNGKNLNEDAILVTYNGRAIDPRNKVEVDASPGFDWSKD